MKKWSLLAALILAASAIACGDDDDDNGGNGGNGGFEQPAGTVAINFSVDDTANKVWKDGELTWKGMLNITDEAKRIVEVNDSWDTNNWPMLYDDGPWTEGGHEPRDAAADDNIWGVTVFMVPPATEAVEVFYGLKDATKPSPTDGWVWIGDNGSFTVNPGQTGEIEAPGMAFPARGTTDLMLTLDTAALAEGVTAPGPITVKGSPWAWTSIEMFDDGTHGDVTPEDNVFTFVLSNAIDPTVAPYPGLLASGDKPQFIFNLPVEYKIPVPGGSGTQAGTDGVAAAVKAEGATEWTAVTVELQTTGDRNTFVTVP